MKRFFYIAVVGCVLSCSWAIVSFAAEDEPAPSGDTSANDLAPDGEGGFEPGEISIGEPLQVPFRAPAAVIAPPPVPSEPKALEAKAWPTQDSTPARTPAAPFTPPPVRSAVPEPPRPLHPEASAVGMGWIGITADDTLVPGRLVVVDVAAASPAAEAGIVAQNTLLGINGIPLRTADELAAALAAISPGMNVKLAIGRGDRIDEIAVRAIARPVSSSAPQWQASVTPAPAAPAPASIAPSTVHELPPPSLSPQRPVAKGRIALGVRTVPVDQGVQSRYRLSQPTGAYVVGVVQDLPASKAGVPPGSVIVALGDRPIRDPGDLTRLVTQGPAGSPVALEYVLPGGESRQAEVVLQSLEIPLERALTGPDPTVGDPALLPPESVLQQARRLAVPPDHRGHLAPSSLRVDATATSRLEDEIRLLQNRVESLERQLDRTQPGPLR